MTQFNSPELTAFSREFTINLSPQCKAFTRALQAENIKPLYSPAPYGREFQMTRTLVVSYFCLFVCVEV